MSGSTKKKRRKPPRAPVTLKRREVLQLDDGTFGYGMAPGRSDDCFRAALATVLQVPPSEIPDPGIDRRLFAGHSPEAINIQTWTLLLGWLDDRGLQLLYHDAPPVTHDRWIGVCCAQGTPAEVAAAVDEAIAAPGIPRRIQREMHRDGTAAAISAKRRLFSDHCLVMHLGAILFDPAIGLRAPPGHAAYAWEASDITYGLSVDQLQEAA